MALTSHFDRDLFHSLKTLNVARGTAAVFDAVQMRPSEEVVAALACAFLLVADKYKVPAQDAFTAASNMMRFHDDKGRSHFEGLRFYLDADVFGAQSQALS